jgi:transaldolase
MNVGMKIFLDTANIDEIKECAHTGLIDGVTTNPSLAAKEGRDYKEVLKEICEIVDGPISAQVLADDYDGMIEQAHEYVEIHKNIVIKVPLTETGLRACKTLSGEGHKVNVTLCFSATQALLAAKAGATFISPFLGRLDDISEDSMTLLADIIDIYAGYEFDTQVLAASIRHPQHVVDAARLGCHVGTMPPKVFKQLFKHPLTDKGIARFMSDWNEAQKQGKLRTVK